MINSNIEKIESADGLSTTVIEDRISCCDSIEELRDEIIPILETQKKMWSAKINDILRMSGENKSTFSKKCGVSRPTLDDWLRGALPKRREQYVRIGLAAGMNIEEMDKLLQRYGGYYGLYPKSLEDAVCIFVLNKLDDPCERREKAISVYDDILSEIRNSIFLPEASKNEGGMLTTTTIAGRLSQMRELSDLENFIRDNVSEFAMRFRKLDDYIMMDFEANKKIDPTIQNIYSLSLIQGWRSSLKQSMSEIRQYKWEPTREKIISIGFHLSMTHSQIDEMLKLAHMEPLCAKNLLEGIIIFILEDAMLSIPLERTEEDYDITELSEYALSILKELDVPEVSELIKELAGIEEEAAGNGKSER